LISLNLGVAFLFGYYQINESLKELYELNDDNEENSNNNNNDNNDYNDNDNNNNNNTDRIEHISRFEIDINEYNTNDNHHHYKHLVFENEVEKKNNDFNYDDAFIREFAFIISRDKDGHV